MRIAIELRKSMTFVSPRLALTSIALAGILMTAPVLQAQKGGGGGGGSKSSGSSSKSEGSKNQKDPNEEQAKSACPGIVGNHLLLEKMAASFNLTCEQQEKIEPLLHDEESVSKPLLSFEAFTPEEKQAMMLKIKLAARTQIRPLLTPEQQKKSDAEAAAVAAAGEQPKKGGKKDAKAKSAPKVVEPFAAEEALSDAILRYSALTRDQKKEMLLQVKMAARRDGAPQLTAEQAAKIDSDIKKLQAAV